MNFSAVLNVFKRETAAYFNAAIAYIFIIVFVILSAGLFMTPFFIISVADMRPFFQTLPFILAVFMPAVTMRLWAEEKRGNTLELLLTFPVGTHEIVAGKFLASLLFYIAALSATLPIPVMLKILGNPDLGMIFGGYLGAFFLGAFFLAVGIFISGFCRDQIVAFILAMMVCFGLHLLGSDFIAASIDSWIPGLGSFLSRHIGTFGHYESFTRGVIDNRDVLYFIIGMLIFLSLNGFWLEGRMKPGAKKIFTVAVLISLSIFLAGNWLISEFSLGRFDLTQGKIYTTADATKKILRDLKVPVIAKFYVSPADKMPAGMKTLEQEVIDKLDELRVAAKGNFQYKVFHMEAANVAEPKDPKAGKQESLEQQMERKGIQPFQVRAIESDEVALRLVYSALTLAYKEKQEEIIPQVTPQNLQELEYLIASKIYRMGLPEVPKLALVAPNEEQDNYDLLELALQYEGYDVTRLPKLSAQDAIPAGTKTLIVVEPTDLNDRQRYEISRFLRGGGSLLLAVQDYSYNYNMSGQDLSIVPVKKNPEVNPLLSPWGFEVDDAILLDDQHEVINVSGGAKAGPFDVSVPVKVPIQILVTNTGMNPNVSITSRLSPIFYLWGTALKIAEQKIKDNPLKVEILLVSTKASWTVPFPAAGVLTPKDATRQPESRVGPFPLALLAQGQFPDAWANQAPPAWPPESAAAADNKQTPAAEPAEAAVPATPAPGKMILIGASSIFQKNLLRGGGHLNFFLNCVDALTLGDELITIRSKQPVDRSLGRLSAGSKIAWRVFVTLVVPLLIALIGFFRVLLRRREKRNYLRSLALSA